MMENTILLIIQLSENPVLPYIYCSLHEPNKFNMLCIPPYNKDNATSKTVWVKALEYCESRGASYS